MRAILKVAGGILLSLAILMLIAATSQGPVVFLSGTISTGESRPMSMDRSTHAIEVLEYPHAEIHSGNMYHVSYSATLGDGASAELRLVTPDTTTWSHMWIKVSGTFDTAYFLYRDTTKTVGTAVSSYNHNQNSANAATLTMTHTPGGAGDGTLLVTERFGNDSGPGGMGGGSSSARSENEWMLEQNTVYLLRATSYTASNNVVINLDWYEHTDKN